VIFKGETVNTKREIQFDLTDPSNNPIPGFNWGIAAAGSLRLRLPGGSLVNANLALVVEYGGGTYAYQLDNAGVANAGSGVLQIDPALTGAQGLHYPFEIVDRADFGISASGGGGGGTALPVGAVTLTSLINIVRLRGDYLSSLTFTNAYITHEIQAGWAELYELVANTHEGYWDKDSTVTTVAAQSYIGLPSDCWRVQGVDILDGTEWRKLRQVGLKDRNRYGATKAMPAAFRLSVRGAELFPTPDTAYTLRVSYTPIVTTLDDSGIQLFGWEEYIITAALLLIDQRQEKPTGEREAELARVKLRVIEAANERRSPEPQYLNLYLGDDDGYNGYRGGDY
jgi:hypothetical protein